MRKLLLSAAMALVAASANAAPLPFMELSNFRIEAIDLDLNDGIEAAYTFNVTGSSVFAGMLASPYSASIMHPELKPASVSIQPPNGTAQASFDGTTWRTSIDHSDGWIRAQASMGATFSMAANTQLTFSFDWQGQDRLQGALVRNSAFIHLGKHDGFEVLLDELEEVHGSATDQIGSGVLSMTYSTGAKGIDDVSFHAMTASWGYGLPTVPSADVPEPGSAALMLLGLAGVAAVRRRRG